MNLLQNKGGNKMLTNKQAITRIKKVYNKRFKQYEDIAEFHVDIEHPRAYGWSFDIEGVNYKIVCFLATGEVRVL